ncbi:MAG: substrate-binding domain-containing protein [Spirochaetales bacterium]|nr:substrate-binding domain-containing protein [Spirochaetales bacterium]
MTIKKRKTIGLFIDWVESAYHIEFISALEEATRNHQVNLLTLVGGAINSPQIHEALCNIIYSFVNKENVDGIIIAAGMLGHYCSRDDLVQFCKKYSPIPIVSISQAIPDITSIITDNTTGLKNMIQHLIHDHHYTKIGFIKGIENNQDAEQRFNVYKNILADTGISFNKNLVTQGDFTPGGGQAAVKLLLDKRNVWPQAIIAANDDMAIGAIQALQNRNIKVPEEIAVVGFDDQPYSAVLSPPLTTVRQPIHEQAAKALETIIAIIDGIEITQNIILPTKAVIRQSCGCGETEPLSINALFSYKEDLSSPASYNRTTRDESVLLKSINNDLKEIMDNHSTLTMTDMKELLNALFYDIDNTKDKLFLKLLNKKIYKRPVISAIDNYWIEIVSSLIRAVLSTINQKEKFFFIETLFLKAQFLIKTRLEQIQKQNKLRTDDYTKIFSGLTESIVGTVNIESLMDLMARAAPQMDIQRCYFAIFPESDYSRSKLILAYDQNMNTVPRMVGIELPANKFIPEQPLQKGPYNIRVHPFFGDRILLGFTVFEFSQSKDMLQHLLRKMFLYGILKGVFIYETMKTEAKRLEALVKERTVDLMETHTKLKQEILEREKTANTLKQAEKQLKEAYEALKQEKQAAETANRIKSEFLANMSHEIRTPLNSILGFTDLLLSDEKNTERKDKLEIIQRSGQHLLDLINDILDFSKIEANKIEFSKNPFSLENLLSNIRNMFMLKAYEKKLVFTVHIEASVPPTVMGDDRRLQQVIVNLVGNAFKFTHKGSIIIDCTYKNDIATISISDTGIGIPGDKHNVIFSAFSQADPSTTRTYGGTGLGLTISRKLMDKMGGSIIVESKPDEGSCFTLQIPLPEIDKKTHVQNIDGQETNTYDVFNYPGIIDNMEKYRILVAEDTPDNQLLFKELLSRLKVNYDIAPNGKETLDLLKKQHYDLLLLDMQMPVMDGLETISRIREDHHLKDLYVIALTAHSLKGDEEKYIKAGCDDYMSKPIDVNRFFTTIVDALKVKEKIALHSRFEQQVKNKPEEYDIRVIDGKKEYLKKLIERLERNCDLFDPQDVFIIKKELKTCLKGNDKARINDVLNEALQNYDDNILEELIPFLKELL